MTKIDTTGTVYELIAKTVYGLEEILAEEIKGIGADSIEIHNRAVIFHGNKGLMYKANLLLRTALKILKPIHKFAVFNEKDLYNRVQEIDWSNYLSVENTFAIDSTINSPFFNHSNYVSLKVKDAIADQFRKKSGTRPSVDVMNPFLNINVHIFNDKCTLSLDSSGISLHKRGHRLDKVKAPLNEVLASGIVLLSGWKRDCDFIDPMCGSGTILIEAAMFAYNIAPGIHRRDFGFKHWKDFDSKLWENIYKNAMGNVIDFRHKIIGSDISASSIEIAKKNIASAKLEDKITLFVKPFQELIPPPDGGVLIMNPPYGERMEEEDIGSFYKMIGDILKQRYAGFNAWVLSSNKEALKHIRLQPSKKITLYNGPLECKFQGYGLYKGSRKTNIKVERL